MKKATFKVTSKTTKDDLLKVLSANAQNTEGVDKETCETAAYAVSHPDKATRSDLSKLVKSFMSALGEKFIVPAFAESKPETEGQPKSDKAPQPENLVKKQTGQKPEKPIGVKNPDEAKKPSQKSEGADGDPKKKGAAKKTNPMVAQASDFPETITIGGKTFTLVKGAVTMADLNREDVEFEFCFWWTKRHLKQYPYFQNILPHPAEFEYNLDFTQLIYVSDEGKVAYTVSDVTEAPYVILPADLEEIDGVRVAGGIEYAIYSAPAETEETDEGEAEENEAE